MWDSNSIYETEILLFWLVIEPTSLRKYPKSPKYLTNTRSFLLKTVMTMVLFWRMGTNHNGWQSSFQLNKISCPRSRLRISSPEVEVRLLLLPVSALSFLQTRDQFLVLSSGTPLLPPNFRYVWLPSQMSCSIIGQHHVTHLCAARVHHRWVHRHQTVCPQDSSSFDQLVCMFSRAHEYPRLNPLGDGFSFILDLV